MSGRKSKKHQKLASTRQSLHRKSNIDTEEKKNDDGLPLSGNEDHEYEKNETDALNENLPALQAGGVATAFIDQPIEISPYSQSLDCKDLMAHAEVANKRRKMGSTRKNNRGFKAAGQNEKDPQCRLEALERKGGEKDEDGNLYEEEKNVHLTDGPNLSSKKNEITEEENKEIKEEIKSGPSRQLITEEEGELKDVTGDYGRIDPPPLILPDVGHHSEPVVLDEISKEEAPVESIEQHEQSVVDDEQEHEFTSSNEQRMEAVITDVQNDFTDRASPNEASMTVEVCDMESTENGSPKQADGCPTYASMEDIFEIQGSVIMPVNKETTCEVSSDQEREMAGDHNMDEDHLVQTSTDLETEPPEKTCPVIHLQDLKNTLCNETKGIKTQANTEVVENVLEGEEPEEERQKKGEHMSLEDPLHCPPDLNVGELKRSESAEVLTVTTDNEHILTSVEQTERADDDQLIEPKVSFSHVASTTFQEEANIEISVAGHRQKMGSVRIFEGKRGEAEEVGNVYQEEKDLLLVHQYSLSSTTKELSKDDKNEAKEETKADSTEYSTLEDFTLDLPAKMQPSPVLEDSDSKEDDRRRKEDAEITNIELCAKSQTKKKKRFGSTRRPQGQHQPGTEGKERLWQDEEATEGTEHDREKRYSEEITTQAATLHLFSESHGVESKVSFDILNPSLTTEQEEEDLKDVTGDYERIDPPPLILPDVGHHSEPVVLDEISKEEAPLESIEKHEQSVVDDEQEHEFTSSNEQRMEAVITDVQNDFTDHASPNEASMTVEVCDMESTDNGSPKQADGCPTYASMEDIFEIQGSVIMPVNKETTCEVSSDQEREMAGDHNMDEDHLVQTSTDLETEPPEKTCPVIHLQDLKNTLCNETKGIKTQANTEVVENVLEGEEPEEERQKKGEHMSLEDPLHCPPDLNVGELKRSESAEVLTVTTDNEHILTSVEQTERADDDQLIEPKVSFSHVASTTFQEEANIEISVAGHRQKMGSVRIFEGKRGEAEEVGNVYQEEKDLLLVHQYSLSSTTKELSKDDKNEAKEETKADSTEYSTLEDFTLDLPAKMQPSPVLEDSDSKEDDRRRKEDAEIRNTELCAKSQTKKKKRFGSTRRLQGQHQPGTEGKERLWQDEEATEGTEHDREKRYSEEITTQAATLHLFSESHSVESKVSLDILNPSLTTEQEEEELKDVTGDYERIDLPPLIWPDVGHHSEPVVLDEISKEEAPLESIEKHEQSVVDDEQEFTSANQQKMKPVITDVQNDFTESTENGSSKQKIKVDQKRKMSSTRKSLRGQLPGSDQKYTIEERKGENIKQQKIEQCASITGEDHLEAITHISIPSFTDESCSPSTEHDSKPSETQPIENLDKKKRKMGSTRKNLHGADNKKQVIERMKDLYTRDDEDTREETNPAINDGTVKTMSGLHISGYTEVEKTEQNDDPHIYEEVSQLDGSLLSEIDYELKKSFQNPMNAEPCTISEHNSGSSLNTPLETNDNHQNILGITDPVTEQCQSSLQISPSLKLPSQTYSEPASPVKRRKMGSTRKTSRNKPIEETGDKKRDTEQEFEELEKNKSGKSSDLEKETEKPQDIVKQKISEDIKGPPEDVQEPTDHLIVCKPDFFSEPRGLPFSHPSSEQSREETSPSDKQDIKPFVKEVDVSTEDGLVSLDDIRKSALYDGSSGKRVKINFEDLNEQVPDFGVAVYNVVMVGNCNVGKTSFIKRFHTGNFNPEYCSTIGVDTFIHTITLSNRTIKLNIWDTAGQERYHSLTTQVFHKAQGLLLMYDITSSQSFIGVRDWISQVQERSPTDVIIMLLGNKKDCAERKVQLQEGEDLSREYNIHFMECSAATGENVSESMKALAWLLVKQRIRKEEEQTILQPKQPQKKSGCC